MSRTISMDETAPLIPNAQRTQQLNDHSLQNFPEVAGDNRTIGPRLVASLVIDSIPGKIDFVSLKKHVLTTDVNQSFCPIFCRILSRQCRS
jgi:hypothetical protein